MGVNYIIYWSFQNGCLMWCVIWYQYILRNAHNIRNNWNDDGIDQDILFLMQYIFLDLSQIHYNWMHKFRHIMYFIVVHYFYFLKSKNKPRSSNVSFDVNTRTKMKIILAELSWINLFWDQRISILLGIWSTKTFMHGFIIKNWIFLIPRNSISNQIRH